MGESKSTHAIPLSDAMIRAPRAVPYRSKPCCDPTGFARSSMASGQLYRERNIFVLMFRFAAKRSRDWHRGLLCRARRPRFGGLIALSARPCLGFNNLTSEVASIVNGLWHGARAQRSAGGRVVVPAW